MSAEAPAAAGSLRLDPLAPAHPGRWEHGPVTVCHVDRAPVPVRVVAGRHPDVVTEHFEVHRPGGRLLVLHRLRPDELDDDIAGLVAAELAGPGVVTGAEDFERVVTGLVRSTVSDPLTAWSTFYANTLAALRDPRGTPAPGAASPTVAPESSLAAFAPVHERAVAEIAGRTVLDLGSCFGFLPLRLADEGFTVTASDHTPGTMTLLATIARATARGVRTLVCDARAVPVADRSVDTVTAVHLLEHLPAAATGRVLAEMCRAARRRVVVAVPFEETPDPVYGHLRRFDAADLAALGERTGMRYRVAEHHGGWLVAER